MLVYVEQELLNKYVDKDKTLLIEIDFDKDKW